MSELVISNVIAQSMLGLGLTVIKTIWNHNYSDNYRKLISPHCLLKNAQLIWPLWLSIDDRIKLATP